MAPSSRGLDVDIWGALVPDLRKAYRLGARGPVLGRLVDRGSHGPILGLPGGRMGLKVLRRVARSAAVAVGRVQDGGHDRLRHSSDSVRVGALHIFDRPLAPDAVAHALGQVDLDTLSGALSLLLSDPGGDSLVVHVLCCPTLPSMGPLSPCSVEDLEATWIRLAGGLGRRGRFLLEEPEAEWNQDQELLLTERLRKLYGE